MTRLTILAATVLAAVACAAPAVAQAEAIWTHEGEPLAEEAEVAYTGTFQHTSSFGGFHCETVHASGKISPPNVGTITSFVGTNCKGTGLLAACALIHLTAENLPWGATPTEAGTVAITGVQITNQYTGGFCPLNELTLSGNITATPDNVNSISNFTLSGTLSSSWGNLTVSGNLSAMPANTFGIE